MSFSHDRRGQSVVVGTVILFGFLILAMATYQVQFVPAENEEIEFEHSQQVEGEFLDLRNSLLSASTTGDSGPVSLQFGTRYPPRTFFLNPPPVSGSLSTSEPRELRIENANVSEDGNIGDFWTNGPNNDAGNLTFNTRSVRYSVNYNEIQGDPDLLYEHSLVVAEFDETALGRSGQSLVRNEQRVVMIPLLDGELSESGVDQQSIEPRTLSASQRTVTLTRENPTEPLEIVLPTSVSGDQQLERLTTEWDDRIENGTVSVTSEDNIRLTINAESYELRIGKAGIGSGLTAEDESSGYIVRIPESGTAIVEVRDRYNNPVTGAKVDVYNSTTATDPEQTLRTDSNGQVRSESGTVFTINGVDADGTDGEGYERVVIPSETSDSNGNVSGPEVYDTAVSPTTLPRGNSFSLTSTISSVGDGSPIRTGTPIQAAEVLAEHENGTSYTTSFNYDPDTTERTYSLSEVISTDSWETGAYDVTVRGQDASGRWTDETEVGTAEVTITEPTNGTQITEFSSVFVTNMVENSNSESQTFSFSLDGDLAEGEEIVIDLNDPQDVGGPPGSQEVQYNGATVTVDAGSGTAEITVGGPNAEIVYTAGSGGDPSGIELQVTVDGVSTGDVAGEQYNVVFEQPASGSTAMTTFGIAPAAGDRTVSNDVNGNVFSTGSLTVASDHTISGDASGNGDVTMNSGSEVSGSVTSGGAVTVGQESTIGDSLDAQGDVTLNLRSEVDGPVTSRGAVTVGQESVVGGGVDAQGDVTTNFRSEVGGTIISDGAVTIGQESVVGGGVNARGDITLNFDSEVDGTVTSEGAVTIGQDSIIRGDVVASGDVTIEQGAIIEGSVTSDGQVSLGQSSAVQADVFVDSAGDISCGQGSTISGQNCSTYVNENY
ncbi:Predicted acyltransferase, contains DUF342 domain [Halorubrum aquaticum]|uniref:Predicted acyltransferase, contains DUF342 domain n=1 Tax=Halorubrum aquaticum TaxID=387340 RepID=A0A1I3AFS9_9EURY|nr:polymer-forming cytoskeletal protein [Halorubrum aquaticum]SFH48944.1 Predicted acyltransferase, contains DUF342 domain [Halorubrum aquaticum]